MHESLISTQKFFPHTNENDDSYNNLDNC